PRDWSSDVCSSDLITRQLKGDLFQVEDNIGGILDHAGDRLKFVQHSFDLYRRDGCALDGTEEHAAKRVADSGTETTLKGLCPEHAVLIGQVLGVNSETFRFLKAFPKHCVLLRPCGSVTASQKGPDLGQAL